MFENLLNSDENVINNSNLPQKELKENLKEEISITPLINYNEGRTFSISLFEEELRNSSEIRNKARFLNTKNINAYHIADSCICLIVKELLNYPLPSYADSWLPLVMRQYIGNAVHSCIQDNSKQFTEAEVSIKVPSIMFSGRIDNIINNDVLVEIKSCKYDDFKWVIKNKKPRQKDFYQLMVYKYILENHLKEIMLSTEKTRTQKPILDSYNIQKLQIIYVSHDLCASDIDSINDAVKLVKTLKKIFDSKNNSLFFINSIELDVKTFDSKIYLDWVESKLKRIKFYVDNKRLPDPKDEFIENKCFFCIYSKSCEYKKR